MGWEGVVGGWTVGMVGWWNGECVSGWWVVLVMLVAVHREGGYLRLFDGI